MIMSKRFRKIQEPDLFSRSDTNVRAVIPTFFWKEEEHADPVKQVTSWLLLNQRGLLSHSDIMMRLGFDPEKQKLEVKRDVDEMRDYAIYDMGQSLGQIVMEALTTKEDNDD